MARDEVLNWEWHRPLLGLSTRQILAICGQFSGVPAGRGVQSPPAGPAPSPEIQRRLDRRLPPLWLPARRAPILRRRALRLDALQEDAGGLVIRVLGDEAAFEGAFQDGLAQSRGTFQVVQEHRFRVVEN